MELGTKQYLYGAGGGVLAGSMVAFSLMNAPANRAFGLLSATMIGGAAGGLVDAAILPNDGTRGGARSLAGLGAALATGAAVGGATGGAMHIAGSNKLSIGFGAAAGAFGSLVSAMLVSSAE